MRDLGGVRISPNFANAQAHPALAGLSDGRFVATWMAEDDPFGGDRQIRARVLNPDGSGASGEFIVNSTATNDQIFPAVSGLPGGNFIVTWYSLDGGDGSGSCIRARLFDSSGTAIGSDFIVESTTAGDQVIPAITTLADGNVAVTWSSAVGPGWEIRTRLFDAGGNPLGNDFVVNSTTADLQAHPAITALAGGRFVETWRSGDGADGSSGLIRVRLFNADGTPVANDFVANSTTAGNQFDPRVTRLADGHFVVTWTSADGGDGQGYCVRARLFDASGNAIGGDFIVNTTTAGNQNSPAIDALPAGQFVVTWFSDTGDGSGSCIMARLFNADGTPVGNDFLVNTVGTRANQFQPAITTQLDDHVTIAWLAEAGAAPVFTRIDATTLDPTPDGGHDFNGDATSDVLWRHSGGQVAEWLINGGQLGNSVGVATPDLAWHFQDTGDFNGDARTDILWRHDSGQVVLWQMDGATIQSNQSVATIGNDWRNEGVGDFNADGKADVLWHNANGQVALWTMNGAQITNNQSVATVGSNWHFQGLLDANGDGKSDVLLRDNSGQVVLWTMNGAQITGNQSVANLGLDWNIVGTGDFNNDGRGDVLLRHDSGQVVMWQMKGAQIVSNTSVATPGNDWHIQDVGDYNGDGRSDVLLRHDNGQVVMWEMNGAQIVSNHAVLHQGGQPATIGLDWTVLTHQYDLL